jgi:hypothetical protein
MFSSCTKDNGENVNKTGEDTYAGITLQFPATMTRVADDNAGIDAEKAVTEIGVFIVDQANSRFDYKYIAATDFTKAGSVYTANAAIPTVTGTKNVFAVINPTANLKAKLTAAQATVLNAIGFALPDTDFLTLSNNDLSSMVMSGVAMNGNAYADIDMTTVQSATDALANPVALSVGRNLAKVVVEKASTYNVQGGTTTLTWDLVAKAKDAYMLPHPAVGTLYADSPANVAAGDAYWNNFTGMTGGTYISVLNYNANTKGTATYAQSRYAFENVPATPLAGNTTTVRIKGAFAPATIYSNVDAAGVLTTGTYAAGDDFYRSKIDNTYWTLAGRNSAVTNHYYGAATSNNDFDQFVGGVGYYTLAVEDAAGVVGVERNNFYLMQINEVRGPGKPTQPTDPTIPTEQDTNIGIEVTVLPWDFETVINDIQ